MITYKEAKEKKILKFKLYTEGTNYFIAKYNDSFILSYKKEYSEIDGLEYIIRALTREGYLIQNIFDEDFYLLITKNGSHKKS